MERNRKWTRVVSMLGVWMLLIGAFSGLWSAQPASATPGLYYVYAEPTVTAAKGVWASIQVTNPTVVTDSLVANFVNILFPMHDCDDCAGVYQWYQIGWTKGVDTGYALKYYVESRYLNSDHQVEYQLVWLGTATEGATSTFYIYYDKSIAGCWRAFLNGVLKHTLYTGDGYDGPLTSGMPSVQAESQNDDNSMWGSVSSLKYGVSSSKGVSWVSWTGYGAETGADAPYAMTIVSTTAFTFNTNVFSDNFSDGSITDWTQVEGGSNIVYVSSAYYVSSPYSMSLDKGQVTGGCSARHTFDNQKTKMTAQASMRVETLCTASEGWAYFNLGDTRLTFAFKEGYLAWYHESTNWVNVMSFSVGTWYLIKLEIDLVNGVYDIYVGGVKKYDNALLRYSTPHEISSVTFQAGWADLCYGTHMWVDDVKMTAS